MMIKHIVMWKFKDEAQGASRDENIAKAFEMLTALSERLDIIKHLEVHKNEGKGSFDAVLITEFESFEDLAAYTVHPEHKKISAFVSSVREDRASVDYVIN